MERWGRFCKESFLNSYVKECYESKHVRNETEIEKTTLNARYEREDLHKTITKHCQNLTVDG